MTMMEWLNECWTEEEGDMELRFQTMNRGQHFCTGYQPILYPIYDIGVPWLLWLVAEGGASSKVCYKISAIKYSCRNVLVMSRSVLLRLVVLPHSGVLFEFPWFFCSLPAGGARRIMMMVVWPQTTLWQHFVNFHLTNVVVVQGCLRHCVAPATYHLLLITRTTSTYLLYCTHHPVLLLVPPSHILDLWCAR